MDKKRANIIICKAKKGDGKDWADTWNEGIKRKFFIYNGTNTLRGKKDISKANKMYSNKSKHEFTFFARDKSNRKIVGSCGAYGKEKGRTRHRVELGWMVHPDYAGRGIATKLLKRVIKEAKKKGIKRIEAEAAVENIASVRLAKKCGFKVEGRKKMGLLIDDGRYVDTLIFGKILN